MSEQHDHRDSVRINLPARMTYLPMVTETAARFGKMVGLSAEQIHKVLLSIEETVVNVIHHSLGDQAASATFEICFGISDPYGMSICIDDQGMPFDPNLLPAYDPKKAWRDTTVSGLGLKLVQGMMDHVEYCNLGLHGKRTLLVKYCDAPPAEPPQKDSSEAPATEDEAEIRPPVVEYTVRSLLPHEAIEVSRGAYKSHGYTFFDDVIYYPEKIRALNEQGLMVSAVAVTRRGEFMGHGALIIDGPEARSGSVDFVFVDPKYRHMNRLGSQIAEFLYKTAIQKDLVGLFCYSVTIHLFSQKMAVRSGLKPLALLLATSPATWNFKGISERVDQRISVVFSYQYLRKPQARTLYPPSRHGEEIRRLYGTVHAPHCFVEEAAPPPAEPTGDTVLRTRVVPVESSAEIYVCRPGADLADRIRHELRRLCVQGVASISLGLSLEDGTALRYTECFEDMGFFFAGVFPESPIGDALLLQYLNNVVLDYQQLHILPGETQTLLDYIRRCHPDVGL
ncbi:MAG: ATP-binding protein [Desulfobacteraceae bacterium]|nr:ATP-binding protein [Desulfobacteraceae bacterium]